jgi:DNA-binding NarL/FixJ family response regulator
LAKRQHGLRVVVVDDQELVRTAVATYLSDAEIDVVGIAGSAEQAMQLVAETSPDVVVMDLGLPGTSGVEVTRRLTTVAPLTKILVLTGSIEEHDVLEAIMAGACGYLLKDVGREQIVDAVRSAAAGESVISPRIAGRLLDRIRGRNGDIDRAKAIRAVLTDREFEVLTLLAAGKDNPQIARELFISPRTVKNHISSILAKLHLENRIQAAVHAVRSGVV